jgi:hypothetical protein
MKQTRLLEIIREEISGALNELSNVLVTNVKGKTTTMPFNTPDEKMVVTKLKQDGNIKNIETTAGVNIKEGEKRKKLAKKYQLDEETINEMASVVQTKKALEKLGDEKGLELVKNVEKETLDQFKKSPDTTSDGRLIRKLDPKEVTGKRDTRGYGADFERNFKKKAGMDFMDFTTDISLKWKEKFPGDKPFNAGLATNTTEKDAAAQIFNLEKGQRGRKADPNKTEKPASTGKKGRPAGEPKAEKVATLTKGDDGFDNVSYSDDEESAEAAKAAGSDKTAKELGKAATRRDKVVKAYQMIAPELKDKIAKAKEGDKEAMNWLKERTPIIKAYEKAKQVKI